MAILFQFDEDGVRKVLREPDAMEFLADVALELAADARDLCPVGDTGMHRSHIQAFSPFVNGDEVGGCYFGSTLHTWHFLEYGTAKNPAYRPLTAAAERSPKVKYTPEPK